MKLISLLLVFIFSFNVMAQDSLPIQKGEKSPFDGVVMTTEKAQSVRKELIEKDQFKLFNETLLQNEVYYKTIMSNNHTQIDLLLNQNTKLVKQAEDAASLTTFEKMLWVGVGVLGTSLAIMGASRLTK